MDFDDEYDEFPETDAEGKQFMAKVGRGLSALGSAAKNGIVRGAKAMDAAADRALVGTQNAVANGIAGAKAMGHRAAGAVAGSLANASNAVGRYA